MLLFSTQELANCSRIDPLGIGTSWLLKISLACPRKGLRFGNDSSSLVVCTTFRLRVYKIVLCASERAVWPDDGARINLYGGYRGNNLGK